MLKLNFPIFEFKLKIRDNKTFIFDILRKKFFILTPEEWVRQHVIHFLVLTKKISTTLIGIEKKIVINKMTKRFDLVVFNNNGKVILLIECKSPSIKVDHKVFNQAAIYNKELNSEYLMITNGLSHLYFRSFNNSKSYTFIKDFPL
ncbi:MAG: type I restriction enzyme HsdR N-terminal domain-containing protein [Bacteroidetes bacterium]|jgi:type I site-specific restriction endonuclease|nr:type I restriction enzyme HsdR N-terminal domain-containing protein [Bacteroidota bacterium]MDA1019174.1 type I restriction enzyme HsdR N-terminal domain-containing protein [Bacteroidota bacterium]|tara:strand:- start:4127 stop:4564 length:438 start_codon:yes stop_codon:yes gene_type:complete